MLENHSYGQVIGNPAMPYLNSLATAHSLAADYFADAHPSIPNYFMLTTGNFETLTTALTAPLLMTTLSVRSPAREKHGRRTLKVFPPRDTPGRMLELI
jgi:hypothetical protein